MFPKPVKIGAEQFQSLQKCQLDKKLHNRFNHVSDRLIAKNAIRWTGNVRSVQPINGRIVQASYVPKYLAPNRLDNDVIYT